MRHSLQWPLILKEARCLIFNSSSGVNASITRSISRQFAPVSSGIRFLLGPYFTYPKISLESLRAGVGAIRELGIVLGPF